MKILNYSVKNNMVTVLIDNGKLSEFVYPVDRFKGVVDLKREIEKKIVELTRKKNKVVVNKSKLINELDVEVAYNARY